MAHIEEQYQWLLTMAKTPGFAAHARRRAKDLQDSNPMYAGMWPRLAQEMGWKVTEAATPASSNSTPSSRPSPAPSKPIGHGATAKGRPHER